MRYHYTMNNANSIKVLDTVIGINDTLPADVIGPGEAVVAPVDGGKFRIWYRGINMARGSRVLLYTSHKSAEEAQKAAAEHMGIMEERRERAAK